MGWGCSSANLLMVDLFILQWAKCEIENTIDSEMSGDLCNGLQTLVKCIRNQNQFLADKLHEALNEKDTKTATRIILGEVTLRQYCFVLSQAAQAYIIDHIYQD